MNDKNDLYAVEGKELRNKDAGRTRGILRRVRAAYDWVEFEVPGGKTVRRDVDEVFDALDNGYKFVEAPEGGY
jgi:hypothetical protein